MIKKCVRCHCFRLPQCYRDQNRTCNTCLSKKMVTRMNEKAKRLLVDKIQNQPLNIQNLPQTIDIYHPNFPYPFY